MHDASLLLQVGEDRRSPPRCFLRGLRETEYFLQLYFSLDCAITAGNTAVANPNTYA
jgi:hypothetical protein